MSKRKGEKTRGKTLLSISLLTLGIGFSYIVLLACLINSRGFIEKYITQLGLLSAFVFVSIIATAAYQGFKSEPLRSKSSPTQLKKHTWVISLHSPPKFLEALLCICLPKHEEYFIGDLHESFPKWVKKYGKLSAQFRYFGQAVTILLPRLLKLLAKIGALTWIRGKIN